MSLFYVTSDEVYDALAAGVEYLTKVRVFVYPNLIPPTSGLWIVEWTTSYELRKLTVKWLRTPSTGVAQDAAMTTHHFLNITGGLPDASWTSGDYAAVEAAWDAYWTSLKVMYAPSMKLTEYHWRADGPAYRPFGTALSPTLRITPKSVVGTGAGVSLPPQVAITVTETTGATFVAHNVEGVGDQTRNRWGRYYLPSPILADSNDGRINASDQTLIANATETFYEACVTAGLIPVVYSPTTGHAWSVLETHVDDIFDVIRSRRYITPLSRAARVITQI